MGAIMVTPILWTQLWLPDLSNMANPIKLMITYIALFSALLSRLTALACSYT